jgi:uncharacterized protein YndB with AHSA1/START domain
MLHATLQPSMLCLARRKSEMHLEAETTVQRPRSEVFDYLSRAEHLPEYVTDFASSRTPTTSRPAARLRRSGLMRRESHST